MDRAMLMILAIVFVVGVVGLITVMPLLPRAQADSPTGNVVKSEECGRCNGPPVCAGKASKAIDYPNACAAVCDNARILYDAPCDQIPRAN